MKKYMHIFLNYEDKYLENKLNKLKAVVPMD